MPEDICDCFELVRNTIAEMIKKDELSYHLAVDTVCFLDEVALLKGCVGIEELKRRRRELRGG